MNSISPKYQMNLIKEVSDAIWKEFTTYKDVRFYIEKWHIVDDTWNNYYENFSIKSKESGDIDLLSTLHSIDGETILKIAIDLGIDTPDFIPSIPLFRNEMKSNYHVASATFEKAFKQIEEHPDIAIGLANSALESIIKEIFKDSRINTKPKPGKTLYELTIELLKEFHLFPNSDMPLEIRSIGSSLLAVSQGIEKLRSEKTNVHGKTLDDYIIEDSVYTYFIVNSVATVALFLNSYYKRLFPKQQSQSELADELPF